MDSHNCASCKKTLDKMFQCSKCKYVRYCSQQCQRQHWSTHKCECDQLKRRKKQKENAKRLENELAPVPMRILHPYDQFMSLWNASFQNHPSSNLRGIENCGNSCYASAILQCLIATPALGKYLNEKIHSHNCPGQSKYCFLCELEQFVTVEYKHRSSRGASIRRLLTPLHQVSQNMMYSEQQDAHEFLLCTLSTMERVFLAELGGEDQFDTRTRETTMVHHVFNGYNRQQTICSKCDRISTIFQSFLDLQLDIPSDGKSSQSQFFYESYSTESTSLQQCMNIAYKFEWLDESNKMKCEGCNEYVQVCKGARVEVAPNVLVVQLKRFAFRPNGRIHKIDNDVTFTENLDLSRYMAEDSMDAQNVTYTLYGVIEHINIGLSLSFGHYIGYVKGRDNNWYMCNDEKVFKVDIEQVLNSKAYLLFYHRDNPRYAPEPQFSRKEGFKFKLPNACIQPIPSDGQINEDVQDLENRPLNGQSILIRNQFNEELQSSKSSSSSQISVPKTDGQWIADMVGAGENTNGIPDANSIESDTSNEIKNNDNINNNLNIDDDQYVKHVDNIKIINQQILEQDQNFEIKESDEFVEVLPDDETDNVTQITQQQQNENFDKIVDNSPRNLNQEIENNFENDQDQSSSNNIASISSWSDIHENSDVIQEQIALEKNEQQNLNIEFSDLNLHSDDQISQISSQEFSEVIPDYTVIESNVESGDKLQRVLDVIVQSDNYKCEVEFVNVENSIICIKLQQQGMIKIPQQFDINNEFEVSCNEQLQGVRIRFFEKILNNSREEEQ